MASLRGCWAWREALEALAPQGERHPLTHEGHVTHLSERDRALLDQASSPLVTIGDADTVRERLAWLGENGVREVIYTPSGSDITRELESFAAACR